MKQPANIFLIDILKVLPEATECFIQAPSLENTLVEGMLQDLDNDRCKLLQLDKINRYKFVNQELKTSFSIYIQYIEINKNGVLLFTGFDGAEYGVISKSVFIPEWFKIKYVSDICMISSE